MTGESLRRDASDGGYEHAGGYHPAATFSPQEIAFGIFVVTVSVALHLALDAFVPQGPARTLFILILGGVLLAVAAWEIFAGKPLDLEDVPDPASLLYPERLYDGAKARRRRRLIVAFLFLTLALVGLVYSVQSLLETGVPAENVPAVIILAAAYLIILFSFGEYHRRRRQSSPE